VAVRRAIALLLPSLLATGAFAQGLSRAEAFRRAQALRELGRKMFSDPSLSASGKVSCGSCHDPAFAYGPPNSMSVQPGGKDGKQHGARAVPSLRYLQAIPPFSEHYFDESAGDDSIDNGPTGGLTWDGRVDRGRDQARIPLLSPYEMANPTPAAVVASVRKASYAPAFRKLRTADSHDFDLILEAFEAWEQDSVEFYPYSSKYDAWLAGKTSLSDQESRGLKLFIDPGKGNCARCHIATRGRNGTPPQFTDYGLIALGIPRNNKIPANLNPDWHDLGMCGPERVDLRSRPEYCGRFMTPTLRNVALRQVFFHNGVFHTLQEAVEFYAQRDSNPEKWYPRSADGTVLKFDDLPSRYRENVENDSPFGRLQGAEPALTDHEIEDLVAFLETLTDGFLPMTGQSR
jgi:cytochrome c peroxidase